MTETTECSYCKEEIKVGAVKCKHCKEWLKENDGNDKEDVNKKMIIKIYLKI